MTVKSVYVLFTLLAPLKKLKNFHRNLVFLYFETVLLMYACGNYERRKTNTQNGGRQLHVALAGWFAATFWAKAFKLFIPSMMQVCARAFLLSVVHEPRSSVSGRSWNTHITRLCVMALPRFGKLPHSAFLHSSKTNKKKLCLSMRRKTRTRYRHAHRMRNVYKFECWMKTNFNARSWMNAY